MTSNTDALSDSELACSRLRARRTVSAQVERSWSASQTPYRLPLGDPAPRLTRDPRRFGYDVEIDRALAKIRACICDLGSVSSLFEVDAAPIASPEHMFFKKRTADQPTSPDARQERPKVHTTWGGVVYVDVNELFESEVGQRSLRDLEKITKRLGLDRSADGSASPDRTSTEE